jgi:3-methylcrotonyl-CoA carboxylase beta subunit
VPVLESQVDPASAEFRENLAHMSALEDDLRSRLGEARKGGGEEAVRRHRAQGKLLAR